MSENLRTLAEVSTHAFLDRDLDAFRRMRAVTSNDRPMRVHRHGEGFIVSLGMFHNGENDAPARLRALGFSADAVEYMAKAAEAGDAYLIIRAKASAEMRQRFYFDLSSAHLRVHDAELLKAIAAKSVPGAPVEAYSTQDGFVVNLEGVGTQEELLDAGFSPEFVRIVAMANEAGATLIDFDNDAGYEPGFSVFDQDTDEDITAAIFEDDLQSNMSP